MHSFMHMVAPTNKARFKVAVDEFCGHAIGQFQSMSRSRRDYPASPLSVPFVHLVRRRKHVGIGEISIEAACF
jgi:hypothetical protein